MRQWGDPADHRAARKMRVVCEMSEQAEALKDRTKRFALDVFELMKAGYRARFARKIASS